MVDVATHTFCRWYKTLLSPVKHHHLPIWKLDSKKNEQVIPAKQADQTKAVYQLDCNHHQNEVLRDKMGKKFKSFQHDTCILDGFSCCILSRHWKTDHHCSPQMCLRWVPCFTQPCPLPSPILSKLWVILCYWPSRPILKTDSPNQPSRLTLRTMDPSSCKWSKPWSKGNEQ